MITKSDLFYKIRVYATKSIVQYDQTKKSLYATAYIKNLSKTILKNFTLLASFDMGSDYECTDIDLNNFQQIANTKFVNEIRFLSVAKCDQQDWKKFSIKTKANIVQFQAKINLVDQIFPSGTEYYADPTTINNGQKTNIAISDEKYKTDRLITKKSLNNINDYLDPKLSIQMGQFTCEDDYEIEKDLVEGRGYAIPDELCHSIESIVNIDQFEEPIKAHINEIFLKKYRNLISKHSMDKGFISKSLGEYEIKLKPNTTLPSFNKVYYVSNIERLQLHSILSFLIRNKTIEKTSLQGDKFNNYASPAYIISRKSPSACPRLIINFKNINDCIQSEAVNLPTPDTMIQGLRGAYLFSSTDLANAYHSINITENSKDLTIFSTELGTFRHLTLPVGIKNCPESLNRFVNKMLHYKVILDNDGKPIFNKDGSLKMEYDPIHEVYTIYDDVLIFTPAKNSYLESVNYHFKIVDKIMSRLAFHQAKISFQKSAFCKTKANFFGFFISNNTCIVDPNRIRKLKETKMFNSARGCRAFLGLLNSFRQFLNFDVLKYVPILSPLTSAKLGKFEPTQEQFKAFEDLKNALTSGPIFSHIVCPASPKLLFADMSGGSAKESLYSAVLCQITKPNTKEPYVPYYLCLEDKNHQTIYDNRYRIKPLPLKQVSETYETYNKRLDQTSCHDFSYLEDQNLGYEEHNVQESLVLSLKIALYFAKISLTFEQICEEIVKTIKKTIFRQQYLDYVCHQNIDSFKHLIKRFKQGHLFIDKSFFIFEVLAIVLMRPIIVLASGKSYKPFREFNADKTKPPLIFLVYETKKLLICRPAIYDKAEAYRLKDHLGTLEVVSYVSKTLSSNYEHLHILDKELFGLLHALKVFGKLIGNSETILCTDSRPLYYLFSTSVLDNSQKLSRWNFKFFEEYPNIKLKFIKSEHNLADFLSRNFNIVKPTPTINLPKFVKSSLNDIIPDRVFTLNEWKEFVEKNPEFLIEAPKGTKNLQVNAINAKLQAAHIIKGPLESLKNRFSSIKICQEQALEFKEIIDKCLVQPNNSLQVNTITYYFEEGILIREKEFFRKIMLPTTLLACVVAYSHLLVNHQGIQKMLLNLNRYYHPQLRKMVKICTQLCFACQITNSPTHLEKLGLYHVPPYPFHTVSIDLIEKLPPYHKYSHILSVADTLTGTMLAYPLVGKTGSEFLKVFLFNIYMNYGPRYILCDQGSNFMDRKNLEYLATLNTQVFHASSHWSRGKGYIEAVNKIIKTALIKHLSNSKSYNWVYILPLIIRLFNTTKQLRTDYTPFQLLYGPASEAAENHFEQFSTSNIHPYLQKHSIDNVIKQHTTLQQLLTQVKEKIQLEREKVITDINKSRTSSNFQIGELVLVKNFMKRTGENIALRPNFIKIPFKILSVSEVTSVVEKVTDQTVYKLSNNHIKRYKALDPDFDHLPKNVQDIMAKRFEQLTEQQLSQLIEIDDFQPLENNLTLKTSEKPIYEEDSSEDEDILNTKELRSRKIRFSADTKTE